MENKKIIYIVIVVLVLAAGYWFYRKSKTAGTDNEKNAVADGKAKEVADKKTKEMAIVERQIEVENKLTESKKQELYKLAVKLFDDMWGINYHDMRPFDKLFKLSDDEFFYLIVEAYPQVDSWGFVKRFKKQDFKSTILGDGFDRGQSVALAAKIQKRIDNFKI